MLKLGVKYTRTRSGQLDNYTGLEAWMKEILSEEFTVAGQQGLEEAREIVESSGTGNSWTGPYTDKDGRTREGPGFKDRNGDIRTASGPGRVHEGEMERALNYRLIRGKDIGLDVGWPTIWETYFGAQDEGFEAGGYRHMAQAVEGMHVIAHLSIYMHARIDEAMDRAIDRITNGL